MKFKIHLQNSLQFPFNFPKSLQMVNAAMKLNALEKEMATHSSVLAWRIPGTGEPVHTDSVRTDSVCVRTESDTTEAT